MKYKNLDLTDVDVREAIANMTEEEVTTMSEKLTKVTKLVASNELKTPMDLFEALLPELTPVEAAWLITYSIKSMVYEAIEEQEKSKLEALLLQIFKPKAEA